MFQEAELIKDLSDPKRLKTILESTSDWIWELDCEANFTYASPQVKGLLGYDPHELIGKSGYDLMPPDEADKISAKFSTYVEKKIPFNNLININLHKDGHRVVLESSGVPFFSDTGELLGYRGIDRDISDRYALERSLEYIIELQETSDNKTINEIMKLGLEKAIELSDSRIGCFHIIDNEKKMVSLQVWAGDVLKDSYKNKLNIEYPIENAGVWLDCYYTQEAVIHNDYTSLEDKKNIKKGAGSFIKYVNRDLGIPVFENGLVVAILGVGNKPNEYNHKDVEQISVLAENIWNIVRRKRAEDALRQSEEKLLESEKMRVIGQLAGGIAHDFNNQLSAILGFADMIYDETDLSSEYHEYADKIIRSVERASDLTSKLLAFSRKGKYQHDAINVNEIIDETIQILERSIDPKIQIKKDFIESGKLIKGDPTLIQNAILNLGINARDAINDSGTIFFSTKIRYLSNSFINEKHLELSQGEYLSIKVADNGEGINERIKSKIFEPFFTTKALGQGTGMGLPAVFGTVKSHGGEIIMESEEGKGTVFEIFLPLLKDELIDESLINKEYNAVTGKTVLIAEDEAIVATMFKDILQKEGYNVHICENGLLALEYYKENGKNIDLVILDMVMPVMNGKDCFVEMKKINPQIEVVFASGFSKEDEMMNVLDMGVRDFIQKPFRKHELLYTVNKIFK